MRSSPRFATRGARAVANYDSVTEDGAANIIKTALDEFGAAHGVVSVTPGSCAIGNFPQDVVRELGRRAMCTLWRIPRATRGLATL